MTTSPDIWRNTSLRYLGYANEVGEALRPVYPKVLNPSYAIAFAYIGCDTLDKSYRCQQSGKSAQEVLTVGFDTFLWQFLASVLIPGKVIHAITHSAKLGVDQSKKLPQFGKKWLPTVIGLAFIPIIIHPIDAGVDAFMDTVRKWLKTA